MSKGWVRQKGFTIVELLIVIVVIGILAAIVIVAYSGVQARAQKAKITTDIAQLTKAITVARESAQKSTVQISGNRIYGNGGVAAACNANANGTDLAALPKASACWTAYSSFLSKVGTASSMNIAGIVDPWGRPYSIVETEDIGNCVKDTILTFTNPYTSWGVMAGTQVTLSFSGYTGC